MYLIATIPECDKKVILFNNDDKMGMYIIKYWQDISTPDNLSYYKPIELKNSLLLFNIF